MAWRCTWKITCDLCGKPSPGVWDSRTPGEDAAKNAVKLGWSRASDFYGNECHLCPACAKLPRPDWWPKEEQ